MKIQNIPFEITDWENVSVIEHTGAEGKALWRTKQFNDIRVRLVEYLPGYKADHWCNKGHILLCLEGSIETELADGKIFTLVKGKSYQVADGEQPHKSTSPHGAKLFIID